MMLDGYQATDIEKLFASIIWHHPDETMDAHPRWKRCLKGATKERPQSSRLGLPECLVGAL
eukprot:7562600-Karenia_brevis.AAC.1